MFLNKSELVALTGYSRFADQRRWLTDHAWTFEVSATGQPVVSRAYTEGRLGVRSEDAASWHPNVASIRKAA